MGFEAVFLRATYQTDVHTCILATKEQYVIHVHIKKIKFKNHSALAMWNVLCSILKLGKPYKYDVLKSTNCLPVTICSKIQAAFINLVLTAVKSTAFPLARSRMPAFISCRTTRAIIFFTRPRSTTKPGVFSSVAP